MYRGAAGLPVNKQVRIADRDRQDGAQRDVDVIHLRQRAVTPDREIAVRRTEREIEVRGKSHAAYPFFRCSRPSNSAICTAFNAAPLRRLSLTHHRIRPLSTVGSSRTRLI